MRACHRASIGVYWPSSCVCWQREVWGKSAVQVPWGAPDERWAPYTRCLSGLTVAQEGRPQYVVLTSGVTGLRDRRSGARGNQVVARGDSQ